MYFKKSFDTSYMLSVLPGTIGGMKAVSVDNSGAMDMTDDAFINCYLKTTR